MKIALILSALLLLNACQSGSSKQTAIIQEGLILDLNADAGVIVEEKNRVSKWQNQVKEAPAKFFIKQDEGRKVPGSGRPILQKNVKALQGHNSLLFNEHELINFDEDAFDHLNTGAGYTWFFVISFQKQTGKLKDVNAFFGNLRNKGGKYEGFWGGVTDDNKIWTGARNSVTFGRWDKNNPQVIGSQLQENKFYIIASRMGAGLGDVKIELFKDSIQPIAVKNYPVIKKNNPSKMAIGTERDAVNHPGLESFDGEIARVLMYERPLKDSELKQTINSLKQTYFGKDAIK